MKKENSMQYVKKDLLLILALTVVVLITMAGLLYAQHTHGIVSQWAESFYYHIVRL